MFYEDDPTERPISGTELSFLIAYAIVIALGVLLVLVWPAQAEGKSVPAIAVITAANGEPRTIEISQKQCQQFQEFQAKGDLFIEDQDLKRQRAIKIECFCVGNSDPVM